MTIEELQEQVLQLTEQNQNLTTERDTLLQDNESIKNECENLRTINQKYFNKLIAQEVDAKKHEEEREKIPTCEEFANTIEFNF